MMDGAFEDPDTLGQVSYLPADIGFKMPAQLQRRPLPPVDPNIMAPFMRWIDAAKRGYATGKSLSGDLPPGAGGEPTGPAPRLASADPNPASSDIGVGGPARARSIPINGPSVAADMGTPGFSDGFGDDPRLADAGAFGAPAQPVASAAPTGDSEDLGDRYRKRVAGIPAPKGDLTDDQKNRMQMDFFLHLLANNKPGSRFLQNAGESGVATSAEYQAQTDKNLARSTQQQQFARDEVFKEMGLSDKSQDNKELARHHKALEKLQNDQNDINKAYREGQIDAKTAELEVRRIQAEMAELRARAAALKTNPLEQQIQTILKYGPKGQLPEEALRTALSKGKNDEDQQIDEAWKASVARAASTGMPAPSRDQIVAIRKYGTQISRGHPDYASALKSLPGGDTRDNRKKLDAVLQTRGLRVVD